MTHTPQGRLRITQDGQSWAFQALFKANTQGLDVLGAQLRNM
jgi:hypothetical protein